MTVGWWSSAGAKGFGVNWRNYRGDSQSERIQGGLEDLSETVDGAENTRCGSEDISESLDCCWSSAGTKLFGVDRKIYPCQLAEPKYSVLKNPY